MITKQEFFKRLMEISPDKKVLEGLTRTGEKIMQGVKKLKGKTITLSIPEDMPLENIVVYVTGIEEELSKLGILTVAHGGSFFPPYGLYPDIKDYINWQEHASTELLRREYFYDLIAKRYDPEGRKIVVCDTTKTNATALEEVLITCNGVLVGTLEEADTAVYLGERFCDTDNAGHQPLYGDILPWLKQDKNRAALVLWSAKDGLCGPPEEPELDILRSLAHERKNVLFVPLGDYYKGRIFKT